MGESVNDSGADAEARERAGTAHESNPSDVVKSFAVFGEFAF